MRALAGNVKQGVFENSVMIFAQLPEHGFNAPQDAQKRAFGVRRGLPQVPQGGPYRLAI